MIMIERHLDDQLNKLNEELLKMAAMAEESIYKAVEALKTRDKELAREIINNDSRIDEKELEIEEYSIELLATQQPIAVDLRFITTGMRINAELERIADLSVNIAQRVLEIADMPLLKPLIDIPKLSEIARKMVKGAIDSFVNRDETAAREVILADAEADRLRNLVQQELVNDYLVKSGENAPRAIPLLLIARHLERIADHATYIAEDIIYMVQAKVVRHHSERLDNIIEDGKEG
jgi:phosphate transport system protein